VLNSLDRAANSALASAKEREEKRRFAEAITAYSAAFQNDPASFAAAMGAARCAMETGAISSAKKPFLMASAARWWERAEKASCCSRVPT